MTILILIMSFMIKYSILKNMMIMKRLNKLTAIFCLFGGLFLSSCDDDLTKVGTSILPPGDLISVYTDTFQISASTVRLDSIFAKTSNCLLGEMYDPVYGNMKADVLCQFYCEEGFKFAYTPYAGKVDSMELVIEYSYNAGKLVVYGDTMTPMQVAVYPIDRPLKRNFYTSDSPENYCDMLKPLGVKTYTAHDMRVPDSIRYATDEYGYGIYTPEIRVKLPAELGQKFYDETINNPSTFASQGAFNEFFPGVYITNTFGSGCLIKTAGDKIYLVMYYNRAEKDSNGNDSLSLSAQGFTVSKEVVQINRFENDNLDLLLEKNPTHTYVKSPAGVCTKLVVPTIEMSKKFDVSDRYINGFNLELKYLPEDEWDFALTPPSHLLLLPEDSVSSFFENGRVENGVTSFLSYMYDGQYVSSSHSPYGYNPFTRTYSFGNISSLLKEHMTKTPDKDLNLLVLPVSRLYAESNSTIYTTSLLNSFDLSGIKIRTEDDYMKVVVLSSKFENK